MTTIAEHRAINRDPQVKRLSNLYQRLMHELHRLERATFRTSTMRSRLASPT